MFVATGNKVRIAYYLFLKGDASEAVHVGGRYLSYVHGNNEIIPGLEEALEGLQVGDSKKVELSPDKAFGHYKPEAVFEMDKSQLAVEQLAVGQQVKGRNITGEIIIGRVKELKNSTVLVDYNHPLAGKPLSVMVQVIGIEEQESGEQLDSCC